jgi:heme exporter protein CcmD
MSHDYFLWMSYGMAAIVVAAELMLLRVGRARAQRRVEEERDLETQD